MRRYTPLRPSTVTRIPPLVRIAVLQRDQGCVLFGAGDCAGALELDHVRASHGVGMKSATVPENLVALCGAHHRWKTEHGRQARPILLDYLAGVS